jgi:hypothetical protein
MGLMKGATTEEVAIPDIFSPVSTMSRFWSPEFTSPSWDIL